jgi:hypothetical protein
MESSQQQLQEKKFEERDFIAEDEEKPIGPVWAPITCEIQNDECDKRTTVFVNVKFRDYTQFEMMHGDQFDMIMHLFNECLPDEWYNDDMPMGENGYHLENEMSSDDKIHLDLTETLIYKGDSKTNPDYYDSEIKGFKVVNKISEDDIGVVSSEEDEEECESVETPNGREVRPKKRSSSEQNDTDSKKKKTDEIEENEEFQAQILKSQLELNEKNRIVLTKEAHEFAEYFDKLTPEKREEIRTKWKENKEQIASKFGEEPTVDEILERCGNLDAPPQSFFDLELYNECVKLCGGDHINKPKGLGGFPMEILSHAYKAIEERRKNHAENLKALLSSFDEEHKSVNVIDREVGKLLTRLTPEEKEMLNQRNNQTFEHTQK